METNTLKPSARKEVKKEQWSADKELSDLTAMFIVPLDDMHYLFGSKKKKAAKD